MAWYIRNPVLLRRILWADALLGSSTAVTGLCLPGKLGALLGLQLSLVIGISIVTLVYAVGACLLASRRQLSAAGTLLLVIANACWTVVSIVLLLVDVGTATTLGVLFLVLQVVIVGGLAWLEGMQISRSAHLAETGRQPTE